MQQKDSSFFQKLSRISAMHYVRFFYRSALFLAATVIYLVNRLKHAGHPFGNSKTPPILLLVWVVFTAEMITHFFPSKHESMGCQKQFANNHLPTNNALPARSERTRLAVAVAWIALNGGIAWLYFANIIDKGILILIALAYSVCDMICILFFCPFQTWFMKNKCCGTCRIYNWDYAMMFTPLLFIKTTFLWTLPLLALVLLIKWEVLYRLHPARFYEATNAALSCEQCEEKLCHHKKQLQGLLVKYRQSLKLPETCTPTAKQTNEEH